ncbi:MAG: hypothetical protein GVY35_13830 [Bacteroidetes bacterium]|nr:hypothetical protein [Bacteroidota bacterium]
MYGPPSRIGKALASAHRLELIDVLAQGPRSIPVDELTSRLDELPDDAEVVAYCRGPYCVFADEAVETLRPHGVWAPRLDAGFPDWKAAGRPTETTG